MPTGKAGSTPTRRSTRATKGQTPTRFGYDGEDDEVQKKPTVADDASPSKRPLRRGSKVVGGYVQQANGEFETIDTTDDDEDADDDVTINAPLAEHAANDGNSWSPGEAGEYSYAMIFAPTYVTVAFAYLLFSYGDEAPKTLGFYTEAVLKAAPILILLLGLVLADAPRVNRLVMGGALAFSVVGDVVLHIEKGAPDQLKGSFVADNAFKIGIVSFAAAQTLYCVALFTKPVFDNARLAAIGAAAVVFYFALTAVTEAANAFNEKDDMVLRGLTCYTVVLSATVCCAIVGTGHKAEAIFGAILFAVSDLCIGLNKYNELRGFGGKKLEPETAALVIMVTYYFAQWLLFRGLE